MNTNSVPPDSQAPSSLPAAYVGAIEEIARLLGAAKDTIACAGRVDERVILDTVHEWVLPQWRSLVSRVARISRPLRTDAVLFEVARQYSEASLLPLLVDGAIWRRSFEKPRGYPGDFGILNYVYDRTDQGACVYARLCHRLGLDVGSCVRTRMDLVVPELVVRLQAAGDELRVLSVGCGSAREVPAALTAAAPVRPGRFLLLDQDPEALASARHFIEPAIARLASGMASAEYLNIDYRQVFRDPKVLRTWSDLDVIYCIGLLDYLPQEQVKPFVGLLYSLLKPSGLLILGNMKNPTDTFWALDFVLDWHLIYRTEAQMQEIAGMAPFRRSELLLEETGNNFVLKLWKAA